MIGSKCINWRNYDESSKKKKNKTMCSQMHEPANYSENVTQKNVNVKPMHLFSYFSCFLFG